MRIIQLLPELNAGGVEKGTLEIAQGLVADGHESIVISAGGRLVKSLENEGSRHITLPVHEKRLRTLRHIKTLRALFETEKPDILHLRSRLPAWLAWLAWRGMNTRGHLQRPRPQLVTTVHGFYSVNPYSKIMTRGEAVICVSRSLKDYVLQNYPDVPEKKLTVIHRGIDLTKHPHGYRPSAAWLAQWRQDYPKLADKRLITLPGRLTRLKGQLDFIKVIAALKTAGQPVHGLLIGEAHPRKLAYLAEVRSAIKTAGLENHITLVGHRNDLHDIMAISDAVVSCSTDPEAFGRVILEALALGRPVAGYDHGGVREQLDNLLPAGKIPVGDTAAMARQLAAWQENPPVPRKKNPFTLKAMLAKTLRLYEELTQSPHKDK
ncbi:MAG: N-acetyl-alpha-D-glucosaminyl L-malate synthase [Verrucomicrobia subdivision 3 bacterium]|nr:N-acetyl-alpha-D-glucosaminyl L-malate synthase [Limisphaerales bacterium]MCS1417679.1 N-acetyl-alpha-D-glucosaminyl L-malate synthase [Limisphaerales bacterium]